MSAPNPSSKPTAHGEVRLPWPGDDGSARRQAPSAPVPPSAPAAEPADATEGATEGPVAGELAAMRRALEELRAEVASLRAEVIGLRRRLPVRATDR